MNFEWDGDKNAANIEKHGIDFSDAKRIFEGPTLERIDDRKAYGETRIAAVGIVENRELFVVYTTRGQTRRIISARKANRHERKAYHEATGKNA